jgi:hypothetical protein
MEAGSMFLNQSGQKSLLEWAEISLFSHLNSKFEGIERRMIIQNGPCERAPLLINPGCHQAERCVVFFGGP